MRERRIAIIAGGSHSFGLAIAAVLAEQGQPVLPPVEIRRQEMPPEFEPQLLREPRRKDWKQRERQRPRR